MTFLLVLLLLFGTWKIYEEQYYKSDKFQSLKMRSEKYIGNCNELNRHIEELKNTYIGEDQLSYGHTSYNDKSSYNYKRPELKKIVYAPYIHHCSRTVCDSARRQPFKYICKYFNIQANENTLMQFETVLNNFEAAEKGKIVLNAEKENILLNLSEELPSLIKSFSKKRLEKELGFEAIDITTPYFPKFVFKYTSAGGNSSMECEIVMDIDNLNRFIVYLSETIKFRKSVAGQRALMTSRLRKEILERDNYTCQQCGLSIKDEPNLLLEIDHIIPVSKGGITSESNLQTLCWKCNRHKGAKTF